MGAASSSSNWTQESARADCGDMRDSLDAELLLGCSVRQIECSQILDEFV